MIFVEIIQYMLAGILGVLFGYQMMLSLFALVGKQIQNFKADSKRKFAIIMPAYHKEDMIVKSLYSMSGLVYPRNMYDLILIVDDSSTYPAKIARNLGAVVLERSNHSKNNKNTVLKWAFNQIKEWNKDYDAVILFNSDSLVSGNYLEVMNYYLAQGSKIIQSSGLILSQSKNWRKKLTRIDFFLSNNVKPMGRKELGLGVGLLGNGLCMSMDVLEKLNLQDQSWTDELEYELILQLEDAKIDYSPEAYIWIQTPEEVNNVDWQRRRWKEGQLFTIKKYAHKLFKSIFQKKSIRSFDSFVDLMTPSFLKSFSFVLGMCGINGLMTAAGLVPSTFLWIWLGIAGIGLLYLLLGFVVVSQSKGHELPRKTSVDIKRNEEGILI